jgi:hypothetical protein
MVAPVGGSTGGGYVADQGSANEASQGFKDSIAGQKPETLLGMLGSGGLNAGEKQAVIDEVLKQNSQAAEQAGGSQGAGESQGSEEDEEEKLRKKLANGTITKEELEKLAGITGEPINELASKLGKGMEAQQPPVDEASEIQ